MRGTADPRDIRALEMNRPAIPTEIRRAVLVEAGHRCAIVTCQHPSVEVHHIIPWEKSQSHDFENLIALCPNCHRRADSEEIDRKSLRMYKAQLGASVTQEPKSVIEVQERWHVEKLAEVAEGALGYEFEFEYPVFEDDSLEEVSNLIRCDGIRELHNHRRWLHDMEPITGFENCTDWHSASFEIVRFDDDLLSINYRNSSFGAGAAHPNSYTTTYNFVLGPVRRLSVTDLFSPTIDHLAWLSKFCTDKLLTSRISDSEHKWVVEGTSPEENHFRSIAIDSDGLIVTFDAYQVDCYAAGPQLVHIPASEIQPILNAKLRALF